MNNLFGSRPNRSAFENAQASRDNWQSPAGKTSYDSIVTPRGTRENNEDYYLSKKNIEDDRGSQRTFFPVTEEWQKEKAKQFKIQVVRSYNYGTMKNFYDKTAPKQTIPVEGDGNCFFRALSTCITGSENEHMRIRELITKHVEDNPELYRTFLQSRGGMNQYLTSMRRPREWATDVEILAAATLLKTIIEVYFPCRVKGHIEFRWQTFKPLTHPDITHPAIYLSNKNDHFDPVLDVCTEQDELSENRRITSDSFRKSHDPSKDSLKTARDPFSSSFAESVRKSHDPSVYSTPVTSQRHESSFDRIHGIRSTNFSTSRSSSRPTHPNVQF